MLKSLMPMVVLLAFASESVWADVSIPPNAQPGAIQSYGIQQFNMQRNQPWLYQPLYPQDIEPQEPDVHWMQTEGQVLDQTVQPKAAPAKPPSEPGNH